MTILGCLAVHSVHQLEYMIVQKTRLSATTSHKYHY